jgi:hypothetical protein
MAGMSERVRNNLLKYGDKSKWESSVPISASTGTLGSDWAVISTCRSSVSASWE